MPLKHSRHRHPPIFFYLPLGVLLLSLFTLVLVVRAADSWSTMTATSTANKDGAGLAYPGSGNWIYGTRGDFYGDFRKYSISGNTWSSLTAVPSGIVYNGGSLVSTLNDYLYLTQGGGSTNFYRYSTSGDSWSSMTAVPLSIHRGGSLAYPGSGDYIYATRGNASNEFYRYSISGNSWSSRTNVPYPPPSYADLPGNGASLISTGGDFLYLMYGTKQAPNQTTTTQWFYRYSISGDSWTQMANTPAGIGAGGALSYPGSGDYIYALRGGATQTVYRYSISGNSWSTMTNTPGNIDIGGAMISTDSNTIYAYQGNTTGFYKYTINSNSAPSVTVNSASERTDGTGYVDASVTVSDSDANNVKLKVGFVSKIGGTCGDDEPSFNAATINTTASNVTASVTPKPDVNNGNPYQIGTSTPILTSSNNTVTFLWQSLTDLPNTENNFCLKFTPNDGTTDGTAVYQSIGISNVAPTAPGNLSLNSSTSTTATLSFGAQTSDNNFSQYKIYYKAGSSGVTTSDTLWGTANDADLGFINYNGTSNTTITGLSAGTQYVARIWAFDTQGNNTASSGEVTFTLNSAPTVSVNSATERTDGSNIVDISVTVSDTEANGVKLKVERATDGDANSTCNSSDFSSPLDLTLDETASNVTASVGTKPDVENDNSYQVGTSTSITTSSSNTVTFDWDDPFTDSVSTTGYYCLRFTPNDGATDGTAVYQRITLDTQWPSSPGSISLSGRDTTSLTFNFGSASSDTNFGGYKLNYRTGSNPGVGCSASSQWTSTQDADLGTANYNGTANTLVTGLSVNTQYTFNICAYDSYGHSTPSGGEVTQYTAAAVPGGGPSVSATGTTSMSFSSIFINGNPGSTTYSICKTDNGSTCASGSSYLQADGTLGASRVWQSEASWLPTTIAGLSVNTQYRFLTRARNGDSIETSDSAASSTVYTWANPVNSPSVTNATTSSALQLQASWAFGGELGMKIERDNGCDETYDTTIHDLAGAPPISPLADNISLSANTCYQYRIGTYNSGGVLNTNYATTAQITTPPGQPQNVTAASVTDSGITWDWDTVTGATSYNLYNSSDDSLLASVTAPTSLYSQTNLANSTQYSVKVRAVHSTNGAGVYSSAATSTTSASAPSGLVKTAFSTSSITWGWTNGGQSAFYASDKNNASSNSGWVSATSWQQNGLSPNTAYTLSVKARNAENAETAAAEITRYTSQNAPTGVTFGTVAADSITVNVTGDFPNLGAGSAALRFSNGTTTQDVTSGSGWTNTGLTPNTQYTYTAYATNGDGDQTSSVSGTKYTLANVAGTPSVDGATSTSLDVTLSANGNPASSTYAIRETEAQTVGEGAQYVQGDGTLGSTAAYQTLAHWGTVSGVSGKITVTGLSSSTSYTFVAIARNGDGSDSAASAGATLATTSGGSARQREGGNDGGGGGRDTGGGGGGGTTSTTTADTQNTLQQILTEFGDREEKPKSSQRSPESFSGIGDLLDFLRTMKQTASDTPFRAKDYLDFNRDGKFNILDLVEFFRKRQ